MEPVVPTPQPRASPWRAFATGAVVLLVLSGAWLLLDLDSDDLRAVDELRIGTSALLADTDGDGLADGWEYRRYLSATHNDTDDDGILDGTEALGALDPRDPDMDNDSLVDGLELVLGSDLVDADTDDDGLNDSFEHGTKYDLLDPDTFDVGLPDAVTQAFEASGQPASVDADDDGIPDQWESSEGLIRWGALTPQAGRRDLLIEYVRVVGPDSGNYPEIDFTEMYARIANVFSREAGITVQYVERTRTLDAEEIPSLVPSSHSAYYREILEGAALSSNPFVTTVVLNPQHDQSSILHGGIAPIRGMLAAVDYGIHTRMRLTGNHPYYSDACDCTRVEALQMSLSPALESVILGDRQDLLREAGFTRGLRIANGDFRLIGPDYNLQWTPFWFQEGVDLLWPDGNVTHFNVAEVTLDSDDLARTTLHELGHTLGLCHLELSDCLADIPAAQRPFASSSTMYTEAESGTVHFLSAEWDLVATYLTCPPAEPIGLLSRGAPGSDLLEAKYGYSLNTLGAIESRACGEFPETAAQHRAADYHARLSSAFVAAYGEPEWAANDPIPSYAYFVVGALVAAGSAFAVWSWSRKKPPLPPVV